MKVLITGESGFLGNIIAADLRLKSYVVRTLGRRVSDDFFYDFNSNLVPLIQESFDFVIHCAGRAHSLPLTKEDANKFFQINVDGTRYLLDALSNTPPKSFVFISTIAVYGVEKGEMIDEESPNFAKDPYGLSKVRAEQLVKKWCMSHNVICTILRLPLIAGENPPGNLNAMIEGIRKGYYFNISGGHSKKSIVLAQDVANIIPKAASIGGVFNLTDRDHPSFSAISFVIAKELGRSKPKSIPYWLAHVMARIGDFAGTYSPINSKKLDKLTSELTFDDSKAVEVLGWRPESVVNGFKIGRKFDDTSVKDLS